MKKVAGAWTMLENFPYDATTFWLIFAKREESHWGKLDTAYTILFHIEWKSSRDNVTLLPTAARPEGYEIGSSGNG